MSLDSWFYNSDDEDFGYFELVESKGQGQVNPETAQITRSFRVLWTNLPHFLDDLLGYAYWGGSMGTELKRVTPDRHPIFLNFYATDATFEGHGTPGRFGEDFGFGSGPLQQFVGYPYAKVVAVYKPLPFAVKEDDEIVHEWERFVSYQYGYQAEFMNLQTAMTFVTSGRNLQGGTGHVQFMTNLTLTWHQIPALPANEFVVPTQTHINSVIGHVNESTFLDYDRGTFLFLGAEPKMRLPKLGQYLGIENRSWDIVYNFAVRDNGVALNAGEAGHNHFYDVSFGEYDLVTDNGLPGGNTNYQYTEFPPLFSIA